VREGASPAFFEDRQLGALGAAVGVRTAGLDPPLGGAVELDGAAEVLRSELGAVIGGRLAEAPAGGLELRCDKVRQLAVCRAEGLRSSERKKGPDVGAG
jgi:hypothetical protein